ncbi:tetratricopeptide repeat-containing response regulator [Catenovulum adriaticum]|uniref:Response regulator n=1 Tax=Catenovulum adriaticum TaxID=2984846 RepID=A0ABY7AHT7_9ALTE|nr:tetratricopeptide repeat-containing response regulator [Catenovulum sp. TS8]WAJ69074.1 response regulator [Catenovulum sp. TS8]
MSTINRYIDKTFLIVDDFTEFRSSLKNMLVGLGAKSIDAAANAEQAIGLYKQKRHDILLCDYNLGDESQDGQQLLESLTYREILRKDTIFIMVTAENSMEVVMGAIEFKPDDYLTKPFTKQALKTRLDKVYEKKQALRPLLSLLNKQNHIEAIDACDELIKARCKYMSSCLQIKGDCLLRIGDYSSALQVFTNVIKQRALLWALMGYAKAAIGLGQYQDAIEYLDKIYQLNPHAAIALDLKAETLMNLGEDTKACEIIAQSCILSPKSITRFRHQGDLAIKLNNPLLALQSYKKVIQLSKNSISAHEEDILKLLNTLSTCIYLANGSQINKLKTELQNLLKTYRHSYKDNAQMMIALEIINAIYWHKQQNQEKSHSSLSNMSQNLASISNGGRCFLRDQFAFLQTFYPELIQNSVQIVEFCKAQSITAITPVNVLKSNQLFERGLHTYEQGKTYQALNYLINAYTYSNNNITIALLLMSALTQQIKLDGPKHQYMKLIEMCVRTLKYLEPSDQRFTLFRQNLKSIKTILASE